MSDNFQLSMMHKTAASFQKLAALRGISSSVWVSDRGTYLATDHHGMETDCGPSVHGLYEWLNRQPGVKP